MNIINARKLVTLTDELNKLQSEYERILSSQDSLWVQINLGSVSVSRYLSREVVRRAFKTDLLELKRQVSELEEEAS